MTVTISVIATVTTMVSRTVFGDGFTSADTLAHAPSRRNAIDVARESIGVIIQVLAYISSNPTVVT